MKLISCHIENFGKLSNADYEFRSDVTEFCEKNGFGKSTLAAFIKAMFYGLPTVRADKFNERKHFYPFDGKKFGGYLVFELGGKQYRITRWFDKKSETADELTVFCGKSPCNEFGNDIGRAVFGVDKESFERTVFITSDAVDMCATSGISAKLNNFADNSDSGNTYEEVYEKLEKAKKRLKATRGEGGLINEQNRKIQELKSEIRNLETVSDSLRLQYEKANELNRAIESGERRIKEIESINLVAERWEQYENMALRLGEDERELAGICRQYPSGIPTSDEIGTIKELAGRLNSLDVKIEATSFNEEKSTRLETYSGIFADGVPSEEYMRLLQNDISRVAELRVLIDNKATAQKPERAEELERKFGRDIPSDGKIEKIRADIEQYKKLDAQIKEQSDIAAVNAPAKSKRNLLYLLIAAVAACVTIAGFCLVAVNAVLGGVLLGVGVIALAADGFIWFAGRKNGSPYSITVNEAAAKNKADIKLTEERVRAFLVPYGYYSQNGIVFDFATFENDLNEYRNIKKAIGATECELQSLRGEMQELINKTRDCFARYSIAEEDLQKAYVQLQTTVAEYSNLKKDAENVRQSQSQAADEMDSGRGEIERILQSYSIELQSDLSAQADALNSDSAAIERLKKDIAAKRAELDNYKNKYGLTEKPVVPKCDVTESEEELSRSRKELAVINGNIAEDESKVESLDDRRSSLAEAEEELNKLQYRYDVLDATIVLLRKAERNLKDRYIAPIKNNFLYYAEMIEKTLGEKAEMDEDFNITFMRGGELRSDKHLSAGQRSVCSLCFRLALVNNMYPGEKPFIIMDDPFVNLDEEHMAKTVNAVKALSRDNQIIYFCCHDSRKIAGL